jgi:hypothetical protein
MGKSALAILFILASSPVAGESRLGKYLCVTDFAAGIGPGSDGTTTSGQIRLSPERQRFFVTLQKNQLKDSTSYVDACFSVNQIEALKQYDAHLTDDINEMVDRLLAESQKMEKNGIHFSSPQQFIQYCLANYTATVANFGPMASLDGVTFVRYGLDVTFLLRSDGEFHLYERNPYTGDPKLADYVYQGRCEFIQ